MAQLQYLKIGESNERSKLEITLKVSPGENWEELERRYRKILRTKIGE